MIRFFHHYVPLNLLLLVLVEALILGGAIYAGVNARFLDGNVIPADLQPLLPKALTFTLEPLANPLAETCKATAPLTGSDFSS